MGFMTAIINALNSVSSWFYQIYLDVNGWVWPFNLTAGLFYQLCLLFNTLAWRFSDFGSWVNEVAGKVSQILSQADILGMLRTWLTYAENAWSWVVNAYTNVAGIVNAWWSSVSLTVKAWIQAAKDELKSYINSILLVVNSLAAAWDSFKGKIPTLDQVISWWGNWTGNVTSLLTAWWSGRLLEVQALIDGAFKARDSLWAGWQDIRQQVLTFFADPVEYIWERFTDWFLGPEV
jgi:hypothetical protein